MRAARMPVRVLLALLLVVPAVRLHAQVQGSLFLDMNQLAGTHADGEMLLYAPNPIQGGSSISHWDISATPNLLMEPALNADLPYLGLDITPDLMADIGWQSGTSTIVVHDLDPAGVGFTDPTPFAGAPGNPATTLGEARINLVNSILSVWANTLGSTVDIDVLVTWTPLPCYPGGATLAAAATIFVFQESGGSLPVDDVWFGSALAESYFGVDASGAPADGGGDIIVLVNSSIDEECLAPGTGYYYGLDGNPPPNQLELSNVMLHELAHGLGMGNFHNEADGGFFDDTPSIYDLFTFDKSLGLSWDQMTAWDRSVSAANTGNVVWSGAEANQAAQAHLSFGVPVFEIDSPPDIADRYLIGTANFGPPIDEAGVAGEIVCAFATLADGGSEVCGPVRNPEEVAGKIALIDRGNCLFTEKVKHAQDAGAIGVIIANYEDATLTLGGYDPSITIPSVIVGASDGNAIRSLACAGQRRAYGIPLHTPFGVLSLIVLIAAAAGVMLWRRQA